MVNASVDHPLPTAALGVLPRKMPMWLSGTVLRADVACGSLGRGPFALGRILIVFQQS
jgi:hypothetical protein